QLFFSSRRRHTRFSRDWSSDVCSSDLSPEQWERINAWLDRIYDDFVGKVAQARNLTRERAHELARGRVWTGADARDGGLVDELEIGRASCRESGRLTGAGAGAPEHRKS